MNDEPWNYNLNPVTMQPAKDRKYLKENKEQWNKQRRQKRANEKQQP